MTNQEQKLRQLLQLKKSETPGPAYFEAFLDEFHRYQQTEIPVPAARPTFAEQVARLFAPWVAVYQFRPQPALATFSGSLAVVILTSILVLGSLSPSGSPVPVASNTDPTPGYVTAPAVSAQLIAQPEELELASISSFDKDFGSPRYVTGQAPGAYDSAIAF